MHSEPLNQPTSRNWSNLGILLSFISQAARKESVHRGTLQSPSVLFGAQFSGSSGVNRFQRISNRRLIVCLDFRDWQIEQHAFWYPLTTGRTLHPLRDMVTNIRMQEIEEQQPRVMPWLAWVQRNNLGSGVTEWRLEAAGQRLLTILE